MTEVQCYVSIAISSAVAVPILIFCLTRGAEPGRKRLRLSLLLLGGMVLLRFGGEYVLSILDMGWRCTPRYTMSSLIWVLIIVSVIQCLRALDLPWEKLPTPRLAWLCSLISLFTSVALVTLLMLGLSLDSLRESVTTINGQPVVREGKMNGGVVRRFYLPVNVLVHGKELEYDWNTGLVQLPTGERGSPG